MVKGHAANYLVNCSQKELAILFSTLCRENYHCLKPVLQGDFSAMEFLDNDIP